jgi:hypothetical protein
VVSGAVKKDNEMSEQLTQTRTTHQTLLDEMAAFGGYTPMPHWHYDRVEGKVTSEDWKVLSYACRRTLGFGKKQDRISLSQFVSGAMMYNGEEIRDEGTGLSRDAVINSQDFLHEVGLMVQMEPNNAKNQGILWRVELDPDKIDWTKVHQRRDERKAKNRNRTARARKVTVTVEIDE